MNVRRGRSKTISVADAVENFLRSKSLRATPHYIETISGFMRVFVNYFGRRTVASLTIDNMEEYAVYLQNIDVKYANHPTSRPVEGKFSKSTLDSHHRTLHTFFNWVMKRPEYGVKFNPMLEVPRPRIFEGDVRIKRVEWTTYLALIEAAKRLDFIPRLRALALLYLMPDTGARAEGICNLKWDDVDLTMRRAQVMEKFRKSREVYFLVNTRLRLEMWRKHMPNSAYVFCALRPANLGQPLTTSGLYQVLTGLSKTAKLPRDKWVAPHDLRHMFATYADEAGIRMEHLQALMGHEDSTTTRRYIQRRPEVLQDAHDASSPIRRLLVSHRDDDERR